MRTTIDMPDELMRRAKPVMLEKNMTFRSLVIDAVERVLATPTTPFRLRDASAGDDRKAGSVSTGSINRAIDESREGKFRS